MNHSIEAEQAVVGGLLVDPEQLTEVLELINYQDFYAKRNQVIFHAIHTLSSANHPIDAITVCESLQAGNKLDSVGGSGFIIELASQVSSTSNLIAYAKIIGEKSLQRKIVESCQSVIDATASGAYTTQELLAHAQEQMAIIDGQTKDGIVETFQEALRARIIALDERTSNGCVTGPLKTGFSALDERFETCSEASLWILAARPGMGKTTLALNVATNMARTGGDVLVFSMEMPKKEIVDKLICAEAGVSYKRFKTGKLDDYEWPLVEAATRRLKAMNIIIRDDAAMSITHAVNMARKIAKSGNLKLVVADYLQLFSCKSNTRFDAVSEISRQLKVMAKVCSCPVLALSQLSRKCEERKDKKPISSDLRESGQIEQDADIITFIHRDEVYFPNTNLKGIAELITTKNRDGECGIDGLSAVMHESRFANLCYRFVPEPEEPPKQYAKGYN